MEESTSNTSLKEENIIIHTSFLSLFILLDIIFINSPILLIKFNVCVANGVTWLIRGRASKCIIYVSRSSIVLNLKNTIKMDLHLQIVQNKLVIFLNFYFHKTFASSVLKIEMFYLISHVVFSCLKVSLRLVSENKRDKVS